MSRTCLACLSAVPVIAWYCPHCGCRVRIAGWVFPVGAAALGLCAVGLWLAGVRYAANASPAPVAARPHEAEQRVAAAETSPPPRHAAVRPVARRTPRRVVILPSRPQTMPTDAEAAAPAAPLD